jgi:hypothetical protein
MSETELEMVERHVSEGVRQLARQRRLLSRLERNGHDNLALAAAHLLQQSEELQAAHIAHRNRLLAKT